MFDQVFDLIGEPAGRVWLFGLLVFWAVLLFGGFILGRPTEPDGRRMPTWTRIVSSLALVAAAWSWHLFTRETPVGDFSLLIAIGMTLGFVGDLFMAPLIPVGSPVLGGIAAFGAGHVAYIAAMLVLGGRFSLDDAGPRLLAWLFWLAIGAAGWYWFVFRGQTHRSVMHWAALGYALLLASTAGVATGLAAQNGAFMPLALGAALFLLSDLIIAGQLFSGLRFPLIGDVIWLTYGPAQMLIVYSIDSALRLS